MLDVAGLRKVFNAGKPDERVAIDALQWGLPVLYDVVRRFCG